jgi:hypothetical protein
MSVKNHLGGKIFYRELKSLDYIANFEIEWNR